MLVWVMVAWADLRRVFLTLWLRSVWRHMDTASDTTTVYSLRGSGMDGRFVSAVYLPCEPRCHHIALYLRANTGEAIAYRPNVVTGVSAEKLLPY